MINWHWHNSSSEQPRIFKIASPTSVVVFKRRDFRARGAVIPHSSSPRHQWQRWGWNWAGILLANFLGWVFLCIYLKHFSSSLFCLTSFTRSLLISGLCMGAYFQSQDAHMLHGPGWTWALLHTCSRTHKSWLSTDHQGIDYTERGEDELVNWCNKARLHLPPLWNKCIQKKSFLFLQKRRSSLCIVLWWAVAPQKW